MPFTARFVPRQPLARDAVTAYFDGRPRYEKDGPGYRYSNPETGVAFSFFCADAPDVVDVALSIDVPRSPAFALEADIEVSALATELDLEYAPFADAFATENSAAHATLVDGSSDFFELPSDMLERVWRWNMQREALEAAVGGAVPRVAFAVHPDTNLACTVALIGTADPTLLPDVDLVASSSSWATLHELREALEPIGTRSPRFRYRLDEGLREARLRHYDLSKGEDATAAINEALGRAKTPLTMLSEKMVYARELARLALGIGIEERIRKGDDLYARFPRECSGFLKTKRWELTRVLGGYTWLSGFKLEAITIAEKKGIVAGVGAGGVVFFDIESGKRLREVPGDVYAGTSIGIDDDARTLAIGNELGAVDVFDVELEGKGPTLQKRATHTTDAPEPPHGHVLGVSPDGSVVIGAVGDDVVILRDGEEPTTFSATGAVTASGDLTRIWTGSTLIDVTTERDVIDLGIDPTLPRVPALSPDGRYLAFATSNGELHCVRMDDGVIVAIVTRKSVARFIAFTHDGQRIVVGDSDGVEVRKVPGLEIEKSFDTPAWDAAVSDTAIYRVVEDRIWTQPLDGPAPPVNDGPIAQLFHSARGPILLATSKPGEGMTGGRAVLWHIPSGVVLRATERLCPDRVNLTRDGRFLCLATEEMLLVLDVGTLSEVARFEPIGRERYVKPIDLDASPDGEHVLACLEDGEARMVSLTTGMDMWRAELGIQCATFTNDGAKVVAGDAGRLRVIDALTGEVEKSITLDDPRSNAEHVLLGSAGETSRALRVIADQGIAIIDLIVGLHTVVELVGARDVIAASPDGLMAAVLIDGASGVDLAFWSVEDREEVDRIVLASADDEPVSAAFSPDGKTLLVGTHRGAVLVFGESAARD